MVRRRYLLRLALALLACSTVIGSARADQLEDAVINYRRGEYPEAYIGFLKLAKLGDPRAQFYVGSMYYQGKGLPKNDREAFQWYRESAYRGNSDGQNNLGLIYRDGAGQPANPVVAYAWFSLSAAQGNEVARHNLENQRGRMTEDQVRQGQSLAQDYLGQVQARKGETRYAALVPPPKLPGTTVPVDASVPRPIAPPTTAAPVPSRVSAPPRPVVAASLVKPQPVPATREYYLVQLGLFRDPGAITRNTKSLRRHGLEPQVSTVELRGTQYTRIRVGPYWNYAQAANTSQRLNKIYKVDSVVFPFVQ